jgi:hypothetical protein
MMFSSTISYVQDLANFLPWLGNLDQSQTMGLSNGSLHDVLSNVYPGSRTVAVTAIGFNITCGYPSVNKTEWKGDDYNIYLDSLSGTSLEIPQLMGEPLYVSVVMHQSIQVWTSST